MTRVTTGTAKNKKLAMPKIPEFRAIQDVAKMAVFSILGDLVTDATCLDLFAGSGNMGIEALSRGASYCDFVDSDKESVNSMEKNLKNTDLMEKAEIHRQEAVKFVANTSKKYDLVFLDPFYKDVKHKYLIALLQESLNPGGIVVFFHGDNLEMPSLLEKTAFQIIESRRYGKSHVDFLRIPS